MSPLTVAVNPVSTPAAVATALLGGVAVFEVALAAGAPWGAAAWGGAYEGSLPAGMRAASAATAVVYVVLAGAAAGAARTARVPTRRRRRVLRGASVVMVLGTVMNLASPSAVERAVWTPIAAALAVSLFLAGRDGTRRSPQDDRPDLG